MEKNTFLEFIFKRVNLTLLPVKSNKIGKNNTPAEEAGNIRSVFCFANQDFY